LTVLAATAAILAGCSGEGEMLSGAQAELAGAIRENLPLDDPGTPESVDQDDVDCVADSVAGVFPDERIDELGLIEAATADLGSDLALTADERTQVADGIAACIDLEQLMVDVMVGDGEVSPDSASCMVDNVPQGFYRDSLAAVVLGARPPEQTIEDQTALIEALEACLTDEERDLIGI
jgi:hypothetical protein